MLMSGVRRGLQERETQLWRTGRRPSWGTDTLPRWATRLSRCERPCRSERRGRSSEIPRPRFLGIRLTRSWPALHTRRERFFLSPFWLFRDSAHVSIARGAASVAGLVRVQPQCALAASQAGFAGARQSIRTSMPFELNELKVGISTLQSFGANLALEPAGEPPCSGDCEAEGG